MTSPFAPLQLRNYSNILIIGNALRHAIRRIVLFSEAIPV
jgi:hypothetical protein